MNFFTKTRVLISIIIVLAALNIAILGTIGFHFYKNRPDKEDERPRREHAGKFAAQQMHLTDEQFKKFDSSRVEFVKESNQVMEQIRQTSKLILDEISSEKPDTLKLNEFVESFGKLHMQQKKMMINHMLQVKSTCTPDQLKHFKKLIRRMESVEMMRGNRNRNRAMQGNK